MGALAEDRWGVCSWCGWRDCSLVDDGPPELWACDAHWPDGAPRPEPAAPARVGGPWAPGPPALDRAAVRMYWERADDDPAPTVERLQADVRRAQAVTAEDTDEQREQLARDMAAHRAVQAARAGDRWVPLGFRPWQRRRRR